MSRFARLAVICSLAVSLTIPSLAQISSVTNSTSTPIPGAGHDYIKMLNETVNPSNGSVSVRIQTPTPSGRGVSLPFAFAYDSNGAQHVAYSDPILYWTDNLAYLATGGWSYSVPMLSNVQVKVPVVGYGGPGTRCIYYDDYLFQDATAGRHSLGISLVTDSNVCSYATIVPWQQLTGGDDYYRANLTGYPGKTQIADADGTVYTFASSALQSHPAPNNYGSGSSLPTSIEDRNGNQVAVADHGSGSFTVTDTLGRTLLSSSGFGTSGNTVSVSGLSVPYTVTWRTINVNFTVGSSLISGNSSNCNAFPPDTGTTLNVISGISLPNNKSYTFAYDPNYGLVNKITYPTGGYVSYTWGLNLLADAGVFAPNGGCEYLYDGVAVTHRYVSFDGVNIALQQDFSYSTNWGPSTGWLTKTTTVTTTDLAAGTPPSTTVYTYTPYAPPLEPNDQGGFAAQLPLEQSVAYKNSAGTILRTVSKTWNDQYELKTEQTVLNDSPAQSKPTSQTNYFYGSGAQVTEQDDYDYGPGAPGTLLRKTTTNYQSFAVTPIFPSVPYIFDRPCQQIVYDGNNNRVAETDDYYDGGASLCANETQVTTLPQSASGFPTGTHDDTNYGPALTTLRGNLWQKVRWANTGTSPTTTYVYDSAGQLMSMTDACGISPCSDMTGTTHTTSFAYANTAPDSTSNFTVLSGGQNVSYTPSGNLDAYVTQITDAALHTQNFKYDFNNGQLTKSTDENSQIITYIYNDPFARPTQANYPDTGQKEYAYSDAPPSPSVTVCQNINGTAGATCSATSPAPGWKTSLSTMDGMGHVVQTQLVSDPDGATFTATTYDGLGRVYQSWNPTRCSPPTTNCGTETTWGVTTSLYDALGRPCLTVPADGPSPPSACPTTPPLRDTFTSYSGNQTTATDETGAQRTTQTDALGRITHVWEAPNVSGYNYQTDYTYDVLGNLLSATQNGSDSTKARVRTFTYDSLSRLLCAANPEVQSVTCPTSPGTYPAGAITYSYDVNGNLSTKVAPKPGQSSGTQVTTTTFSYDVLNRITQKSYANPGSPKASYAYDGSSPSCSVALPSITSPTNLIGRLSASCSNLSSSRFSYDPMGRLINDVRNNKGGSTATKLQSIYTYWLDGSLNTLTYPSTHKFTYTVSRSGLTAGRTVQVSDDAGNNFVTAATYAPQGALAGMTSGTNIVTSNLYNSRLQPLLLSAGPSGGNSVISLCYDFHLGVAINKAPCSFTASTLGDNGNVYQAYNYAVTDGTQKSVYAYDPLNRIQQANSLATSGTNCWGEAYTVDAWGNLNQINGVSGMTGCSTEPLNGVPVTVQNHLNGHSYDIAGNALADGAGNAVTFDAENRIATDAGYTYSYDANGMRSEKAGTTGTMYWPGPGGNLAETDLTGAINEEYVFFGGERIARIDRPSGTVHYYFSDHLQSLDVITDPSGTVQERCFYYPYGGQLSCTGSDPNHYKFTGKERDSESGLDNFIKRYHASSLGRFMTPDPIMIMKQKLRDPQQWNMYAYARNNPLRFLDLKGEYACEGTTKQCQDFEKARKSDLKSDNENVRNSAASYGDPTETKNGVTVKWGDTGIHSGTTHASVGVDASGKLQFKQDVTLKNGLSGVLLKDAVAHEGVHVEDAQTFAKTVTADFHYDVSKNLTSFQTELNAYRVSQSVLSAAGVNSSDGLGESLSPKNVDATIFKLLADPANGYNHFVDDGHGSYVNELNLRQLSGLDTPNP